MKKLAPLNNSVVFKKLFRHPEVLSAFISDVTGVQLELTAENIELERKFDPPVGNIDIALDIFAEDPKHRVIVEIQRVRYDYHYDRFLHYHQAAIVELAQSYSSYKLNRTVYTIVWLTAKSNKPEYQHSLITTEFCSVTESGEKLDLYRHKLFFLNPFYIKDQTPEGLVDWLQLVEQSITHPRNPQFNQKREIIRLAADIIEDEDLTPQERAILLEEIGYQENLTLKVQEGYNEATRDIAVNLLAQGLSIEVIAAATGLSAEIIHSL